MTTPQPFPYAIFTHAYHTIPEFMAGNDHTMRIAQDLAQALVEKNGEAIALKRTELFNHMTGGNADAGQLHMDERLAAYAVDHFIKLVDPEYKIPGAAAQAPLSEISSSTAEMQPVKWQDLLTKEPLVNYLYQSVSDKPGPTFEDVASKLGKYIQNYGDILNGTGLHFADLEKTREQIADTIGILKGSIRRAHREDGNTEQRDASLEVVNTLVTAMYRQFGVEEPYRELNSGGRGRGPGGGGGASG